MQPKSCITVVSVSRSAMARNVWCGKTPPPLDVAKSFPLELCESSLLALDEEEENGGMRGEKLSSRAPDENLSCLLPAPDPPPRPVAVEFSVGGGGETMAPSLRGMFRESMPLTVKHTQHPAVLKYDILMCVFALHLHYYVPTRQ